MLLKEEIQILLWKKKNVKIFKNKLKCIKRKRRSSSKIEIKISRLINEYYHLKEREIIPNE